ncbi:HAD family hydrolase [Sulfobacillus thermosulfidooxidans]|uniref:HAD family hydrolase n=1 Tax=Sulfobacillus thermosulfidooxidans TaxID=28034 RepID=UPI00096B71FB|nr:HAD-IA family hydrolase [Sulfobacillus thermosulfidooxidans]OLZ11619.1 hypothetical protein BFX05_06370 [Sulfobacillus thermosulfidooxidans]OLZ17496.1 hypothetical protein BFX06_13320 [Sulfobacillus thermosulfidooxidans]OLZ21029.1 hypothetical protein BFX07_13495 [Sulfobacillus thermosulfidooxidans]
MKPIQAVLFDLDDTLYDRIPAIRTYATTYFFRDFHALLKPMPQQILADVIVEADGGPIRSGKEAMHALQRMLPWKATPPDWQQLMKHWFTYFPLCSHWTPEMEDTLRALKQRGLKLAVVTNGQAAGQNQKIDTLGIRPYLDAISISGEVGVKKPEPEIFHHALSILRVAPQDAVFVGDNPVMDIYGATRTGMQAIWLRRYDRPWYGPLPSPPQRIFALSDVLKILS